MSLHVYRSLSAVNRVSELPCLANQQGMTPPVYESLSSFAPLPLSQPEDVFHADSEGHENLGQKPLETRRWQRKVIFRC